MPAPPTRVRIAAVLYSLLWIYSAPCAHAQTPAPEVGFIASWVNIDEETGLDTEELHRGVGGRLTLNLNRFLGIDSEYIRYLSFQRRQPWKASWNLKVTARQESSTKMNFFALTGFGLMPSQFSTGSRGMSVSVTSALFNLGGGLEFVPHHRTAIRLGLVDSLLWKPRETLSPGVINKFEINLSMMLRTR